MIRQSLFEYQLLMKKWKEMPKNEKWMIVIILLLALGIFTRWDQVKKGIGDSFSFFGWTEQTTPTE